MVGVMGNNVCGRGLANDHNSLGGPGGFYCPNGNGVGAYGGGVGGITTQTPTTLSSPWHPHPPTLHPPPLHSHPHHPSAALMHHPPPSQDGGHILHHDNIVALNDPDYNDESATSDLATSFFGYRCETIYIATQFGPGISLFVPFPEAVEKYPRS